MKILIVGGTGKIGAAVAQALQAKHEILIAGRSEGDVQVDICEPESIKAMYQQTGKLDAVIATTGKVHFAPLHDLNTDNCAIGLNNKLMGQVNLVLLGLDHVNDGGSFTLTSGILNHQPIPQGVSAAMVNGGLEGFVTAAATELPRGKRINLVSPTVITEALDVYADFFPGFSAVDVAQVAQAYVKSVSNYHTGQIYKLGYT